MMKRITQLIAAVGFSVVTLLLGSDAMAQEAPDALIKRVSEEVIQTVARDKAIQSGDRRRITQLIETRIMPHVDFERTTALAMGRSWRDATTVQKKQLTNEFRTLLMRTYANAMSLARDQKFEFTPLRADPADTEVEVHSWMLQPRGDPVQVSYRLVKSPDGWKIYDVSVLGVWLVETYKTSFATAIDKGGIDGLINTLSEKNKKLAGNADAPARTS